MPEPASRNGQNQLAEMVRAYFKVVGRDLLTSSWLWQWGYRCLPTDSWVRGETYRLFDLIDDFDPERSQKTNEEELHLS